MFIFPFGYDNIKPINYFASHNIFCNIAGFFLYDGKNKERKITYRLDLPFHQQHRHHDARLLDLRRPTQPEPVLHAERQQQLALRPEQQHFVAIQLLAEVQHYVPTDPKPIALESKYENGSIYNRYFCLIFFHFLTGAA